MRTLKKEANKNDVFVSIVVLLVLSDYPPDGFLQLPQTKSMRAHEKVDNLKRLMFPSILDEFQAYLSLASVPAFLSFSTCSTCSLICGIISEMHLELIRANFCIN